MVEFPPDLEITMSDVAKAGYCGKQRFWWRRYGLDAEFKTLVRGGSIPASVIAATGDPHAIKVIERKLQRIAANG